MPLFGGKESIASAKRDYTSDTLCSKPSQIADVCEFPHYGAIFFVV
jgi:hypothetical protein